MIACCRFPHFPYHPTSSSSSSSSISALHVKARDRVHFRSQCFSSCMTAVIDIEKLQVPAPEAHDTSLAASRGLGYVGAKGPAKTAREATLPAETLFTDEEATVVAAAAEAIALARAAVEVAKDAAQLIGKGPFVKMDHSEDRLSEADILQLERIRLTEIELVGIRNSSVMPESKSPKRIGAYQYKDGGLSSSKHNELTHLEIQESQNITVRSGRRTERRDRRARAAGKDTSTVISMNSGSSVKKNRSAVQEIDYSDPLHYLQGTTSTSKLLTSSEEVELSEGIQDFIKLEKLQEELAARSGGQVSFAQWATAARVDTKTLRRRLNYGTYCKDKMVKSNIRLVISIAKSYQGAGMNLQDLVQEGCRGLIKGAEKFDASKGFRFSTYAHWWIKQAVRKSLSDQSRTIRLPFHMVDATYRVREARKQFYSENGRYPDNEEVAEATGLTMTRLTAVMLAPRTPISLDQKIGIDQSLKPSDVISNPDASTSEEILVKQLMKQDLNKVLDSLNPRENQVVRWRFGLEDGRMKTLQEIGDLMGVSRERVRQIESCAFRKLKNKKRTKNLRQYLIS